MIIDEKLINAHLKDPTKSSVEEIIDKSLELKGLSIGETARLLLSDSLKEHKAIFAAANTIKDRIYGKRLVLFAPLYTTNICTNNCLYCAFRRDNKKIKRKSLSLEEIKREVIALLNEGHKRILLVAGEDPEGANIENLERIIKLIYEIRTDRGEIRRLNVNVAPMSVMDFKRLKATGIGTYQLFQETYHRETYAVCHPDGQKSDYGYRISAMDRAMQAGISDVGVGALFGLYDYRFEVLALLSHAQYLDAKYKAGPHTISVPRIEPALEAPFAAHPPAPVSDEDFRKLVAIIRLAVPYTGMILSTRETAQMRNELFGLGISQISAGSRTSPGGYSEENGRNGQFELYDSRPLNQVIKDAVELGYAPSFCTACYRLGRVGADFMDLAKPGEINKYCLPNALLTFKEYLMDYADPETKKLGEQAIAKQLNDIEDQKRKELTIARLKDIEHGRRDLYF